MYLPASNGIIQLDFRSHCPARVGTLHIDRCCDTHRWEASSGMTPKIHRYICSWILGASCASEGRSAHHPLCRALTSGEQPQPTRFPSAYICYGEDDASTCAPRTAETLGATFPKADTRKVGGIQRSTSGLEQC